MFDHLGIGVTDIAVSKAFYEKALAPLGIAVIMEFDQAVGFGENQFPYFWIRETGAGEGVHVAFNAPDAATVDAFHKAALAAGGRDNGGPGKREIYHPNYYGAFVLDPDGYNVEAVCHSVA